MTDMAMERAKALARCTMLPGTWDKRFVRSVAAIAASGVSMTDKQVEQVDRLAWKYRRQLPVRLVPEKPE
jgi:hypothetical protein